MVTGVFARMPHTLAHTHTPPHGIYIPVLVIAPLIARGGVSWHISYIIKHIILAGNAFLPPPAWWQLELSSACCRRWSILNSSRQVGALWHSADLLLTTSIMSFGNSGVFHERTRLWCSVLVFFFFFALMAISKDGVSVPGNVRTMHLPSSEAFFISF